MGIHRDQFVSGSGGMDAEPPRPAVVTCRAQPPTQAALRHRFLDRLSRKINLEHDKSFVKVS